MNESDLRPAREFALQFGVKTVLYGPPGSGKTPIAIKTTPRPVLLLSEPGLLSARDSTVPTWPGFSPPRIDEFMLWFKSSHEARNYDTLIWDSTSQSAERRVEVELGASTKAGNEAHGMRAYGVANRWMYGHLNDLYFMPQKHIVLIAKQELKEINGSIYKRPYFPGRELPVRVPHLYDNVLRLDNYSIPEVNPTAPTKAFLCHEQFDAMGRNRTGTLAIYEPPDFNKLIAKCMA